MDKSVCRQRKRSRSSWWFRKSQRLNKWKYNSESVGWFNRLEHGHLLHMMDRNKLIEELIMDEGYKYETYHDHLGFLTLGVGHLVLDTDPEINKPVGTPVSEERIKECLNNDLDIVCEELDRNMSWWRGLDGTRQRVLANMCFNLGYPRLSKFVKFIAAMQKGDWKKASEEMMDSKWATQVGNRAVRLQQMVTQGEK